MPLAPYYPAWFNPDEHWLPQGQLVAPQMTLIENKLFAVDKRRTDIVNPDDLIGRGGITAVKNTNASNDKQLLWVYNQIFQYYGKSNASELTNADIDAAADSLALVQCYVDELGEGQFGMPYGDAKYKRFWDRMKARLAAAGKPYRHFHTYGGFSVLQGDPWQFMSIGGANTAPNDPIFKALLQNQAAARKKPNGSNQDFYALFYDMGMGANVKHYADQPDYASRYYNKAYACEVQNLAFGQPRGLPSSKLIYVSWFNIEGLGFESQDLHNGHYYERYIPGKGTVRTEEHPQTDFDYQVGDYLLNGFCRMGGLVIFDVAEQWGTDPNTIDPRRGYQWFPDVPGTPPPLANPGYPPSPMRGHDAAMLAAFQYNQTHRTAFTPWLPCEYKEEGGDWVIPPSDNTSILEHAAANAGAYGTGRRGRADAIYRELNGAIDMIVFDPSRDKTDTKNLLLRPKGAGTTEYPVTLRGSRNVQLNETL